MKFDDIKRLILNYSGHGICFRGNYPSWEEAAEFAEGYDDNEILNRVIAATNKVVSGVAAYERDGVAFHTQRYPFPLLTCLQKVFIREGRLSVLDFGGALGSLFYQFQSFCNNSHGFKWAVVEQQHFVDWGNDNLQTDILSFHSTIETALGSTEPNIVLFSSVLQYIDKWQNIIDVLKNAKCIRSIIIDRTPFLVNPNSGCQIALQKIPKSIGESSYPIRLFQEKDFLKSFSEIGFNKDFEWDAIDPPMGGFSRKVIFKGYFLNKYMWI